MRGSKRVIQNDCSQKYMYHSEGLQKRNVCSEKYQNVRLEKGAPKCLLRKNISKRGISNFWLEKYHSEGLQR